MDPEDAMRLVTPLARQLPLCLSLVWQPLICLSLGACVLGPTRAEQMTAYVGQPVTTLIAGMGVPNRTYDADGVHYLAYDEQRLDVLPGSAYGYGPWSPGLGPFGYGWGPPAIPPTIVQRGCETTFLVADNVVRSFTLRGNACG
jgi:hypothetical protein